MAPLSTSGLIYFQEVIQLLLHLIATDLELALTIIIIIFNIAEARCVHAIVLCRFLTSYHLMAERLQRHTCRI